MYEFLDRLITSSLPRVRDFSGIKSYVLTEEEIITLVLEQIIFQKLILIVNKISGMDISL
jgi:large subunit ribosomal protein L5